MGSGQQKALQIVFVVQQGELELKAILLASSLRSWLGEDVRLVAACPEYGQWGALEEGTRQVLRELDVDLIAFVPDFAPDYPIGNKIGALALLEEGRPSIFLDSDILCLAPFRAEQILPAGAEQQLTLAAKPADLRTWGTEEQWQLLSQGLGLNGAEGWVHTTVDGQLIRSYFNAGLVATCHPKQLGSVWRDECQRIRNLPVPPEPIYPWLDQIALAVCAQYRVAARVGLDERWNFPAHLRALPEGRLPTLCHYHRPGVILREPGLLAAVRKIAGRFPHVRQLIKRLPDWQPLLRARLPQVRPKTLKGRDFLITGVPRSGTSLLCKLLSKQNNWLILNEPPEAIPYLRERRDASGVALLHREYRERILLGQPIQNKIRDGEMIDDTALGDDRQLYHPAVRGRYFRMGSKNTLAYLASLPQLCKLGWPVVAMVRHPLDSLSSWENTFSHLREAHPDHLPLTEADFYGWSGWQLAALDDIAGQADPAVRRVLLWRMLAQTLLGQSGIHLWSYEGLVADPSAHIRQLRRGLGAAGAGPRIKGLTARQRDHLQNPHRELLGDLCRQELALLGYHL